MYLLGLVALPNNVCLNANSAPHSADVEKIIRINGGNRKRGLMAWARKHSGIEQTGGR